MDVLMSQQDYLYGFEFDSRNILINLIQTMTKKGKDRSNGQSIHPSPKKSHNHKPKVSQQSKSFMLRYHQAQNEDIYVGESSIKIEEISQIQESLSFSSSLIKQQHLDEYIPQQSHHQSQSNFVIETKHKDAKQIIFHSQHFIDVNEIDFKIYLDSFSRTKVYAIMLVNSEGKIIYSDKLGHQLFQGSLNNFDTLKIQNLFLKTIKKSFVNQLKNTDKYNKNTIFNWIIYSKNTKRRYSRVPFVEFSDTFDTFYRFLKGLTARVRPVRIFFEDYQSIDGFWNKELLKNQVYNECFMLQVKLSETMPNISRSALENDHILKKYIRVNLIKAERWVKEKENSSKRVIEIYEDSSSSLSESLSSKKDVIVQRRQKARFEFMNQSPELSQLRVSRESKGVKLITEFFIDDI